MSTSNGAGQRTHKEKAEACLRDAGQMGTQEPALVTVLQGIGYAILHLVDVLKK